MNLVGSYLRIILNRHEINHTAIFQRGWRSPKSNETSAGPTIGWKKVRSHNIKSWFFYRCVCLPVRYNGCFRYAVRGMILVGTFDYFLTGTCIFHLAIFHDSQENNWRIIVRLYRGPMLIALFLFFMGLNVQVNSGFDVVWKKKK